jgi:hypothetical protein
VEVEDLTAYGGEGSVVAGCSTVGRELASEHIIDECLHGMRLGAIISVLKCLLAEQVIGEDYAAVLDGVGQRVGVALLQLLSEGTVLSAQPVVVVSRLYCCLGVSSLTGEKQLEGCHIVEHQSACHDPPQPS